jgi:riboflavin synthase
MFTGLIREIAEIKSFQNGLLTLKAKHKPGIGDSIAVNGACLTATALQSDGFAVELSHESQALLALERYRGKVHIEPAMQLGSRIEGHLIQGHIDCVGVVEAIIKKSSSYDFFISVPKEQMKFMIPKGSVAVDGVSLTLNDVQKETFRLTIIPHTMDGTLLSTYQKGTRVNIETDMFARYVYHLFKKEQTPGSTWDDVDKIMALY